MSKVSKSIMRGLDEVLEYEKGKLSVECMPCDTVTYYKKSDIELENYSDDLEIGYIKCSKCGIKIIVP